jgi:hypothetical protein
MSLIRRHSAFKRAGGSTLLGGLLAYWDFDETSGNLINQLGDSNFDGTLVGGVTQGQTGKVGTSYLFNGTTGYINLASETLNLSTTDFTFDCWVNSLAASGFIFDKRDSGADGFLFFLANNIPTAQINGNNIVGGALSINTWYHLLFTADRDGNGIFYVNGSAGTPVSIAAFGNLNITAKARIGARSFTSALNFYKGNLDETGIWNRVLTPTEIALRYNSGNGNTYPF